MKILFLPALLVFHVWGEPTAAPATTSTTAAAVSGEEIPQEEYLDLVDAALEEVYAALEEGTLDFLSKREFLVSVVEHYEASRNASEPEPDFVSHSREAVETIDNHTSELSDAYFVHLQQAKDNFVRLLNETNATTWECECFLCCKSSFSLHSA